MFLNLNILFIVFAVLFASGDFSFLLKLLFATSKYGLGNIDADKHKTISTTASTKSSRWCLMIRCE